MNDAPEGKLPEKPGAANPHDGGPNINALRIDHFHYNPHALTELRKLAETSPELASDVVKAQREAKRLDAGSERVGILAALMLGMVCVIGAVIIVIKLGWWQTLIFIGVMLGTSHLVRTVLTGEWSETGWFAALTKVKKDPD